jgi:hypothetical protein
MIQTINGIDLLMLIIGIGIGLRIGIKIIEDKYQRREAMQRHWSSTGVPIAYETAHKLGINPHLSIDD